MSEEITICEQKKDGAHLSQHAIEELPRTNALPTCIALGGRNLLPGIVMNDQPESGRK